MWQYSTVQRIQRGRRAMFSGPCGASGGPRGWRNLRHLCLFIWSRFLAQVGGPKKRLTVCLIYSYLRTAAFAILVIFQVSNVWPPHPCPTARTSTSARMDGQLITKLLIVEIMPWDMNDQSATNKQQSSSFSGLCKHSWQFFLHVPLWFWKSCHDVWLLWYQRVSICWTLNLSKNY